MLTFTLMSIVSVIVWISLLVASLGMLGSFFALQSVKTLCNKNMEMRDFLKPTATTLLKLYVMRTGMVSDLERGMVYDEEGRAGMDSRWRFVTRVSNYRFIRFAIVFGVLITLGVYSHSVLSTIGLLVVGLFSYELDKTWLKIIASNMAILSEISSIVPPGAEDEDDWDDNFRF